MKFFKNRDEFKKLIILGNDKFGVDISQILKKKVQIEVFIGPRQKKTLYNKSELLIEKYKKIGINVKVTLDIMRLKPNPFISPYNSTLILSLSSPFIINKKIIDLYGNKIINCHKSPLPEWRGGGGMSYQILNDDRRGNICFHLLIKKIDKGSIVHEKGYFFPKRLQLVSEWIELLEKKSKREGIIFMKKITKNSKFKIKKQKESLSTYFPRIHTPTHGFINWTWDAREIQLFINAFSYPYEGAKSFINNKTFRMMKCKLIKTKKFKHPYFYGIIFKIFQNNVYVSAKNGILIFNKKDIKSKSKFVVGDKFFTESKYLDKANKHRVKFSSGSLKKN